VLDSSDDWRPVCYGFKRYANARILFLYLYVASLATFLHVSMWPHSLYMALSMVLICGSNNRFVSAEGAEEHLPLLDWNSVVLTSYMPPQ
jgi:hypothetical protein